MSAGWGTGSFSGIIRAAQIANTGSNQRRLIIVLSDGKDSPYHDQIGFSPNGFHKKLISNSTGNYCDIIRDTLNKQVVDDENVEAKIAVIGIDYNASDNSNLMDCAGSKNVYTAKNFDDVYNLIIGLIDEEVGRLYKPSSIKIPADS